MGFLLALLYNKLIQEVSKILIIRVEHEANVSSKSVDWGKGNSSIYCRI